MKFDFESIIDRIGTYAYATDVIPIPDAKVDERFYRIPMWIADMNFATVPTIKQAMMDRAKHPLYGYFLLPDEYFNSIINWQKKRHGICSISKENIGYENGVLGGVVSATKTLASYGDNILLHAPTYIGFTKSLTNMGYNLVHSTLYVDNKGIWRMNYDDMEDKIIKNNIHCAIFCNPHNPSGRVWSKEEIGKAYEIFRRHDVYVIEDSIWSDIILDNNKYTPAQFINEDSRSRTITFYAPSKTFNLAGFIGSYHIVSDKRLRDRLVKESSLSCYNSPNIMSIEALIGAYKEEGHIWVDELNKTLSKNINYAYNYIIERFEGVKVQKPEGTYLLYLNIEKWLEKNDKNMDETLQKGIEVGVIWQDGRDFKWDNTIRMNLAIPYSRVVEAMERLNKYIFNSK